MGRGRRVRFEPTWRHRLACRSSASTVAFACFRRSLKFILDIAATPTMPRCCCARESWYPFTGFCCCCCPM
eukprot:5575056-Prymnesium_polylepis.2